MLCLELAIGERMKFTAVICTLNPLRAAEARSGFSLTKARPWFRVAGRRECWNNPETKQGGGRTFQFDLGVFPLNAIPEDNGGRN
jgi:hypothetical protein